jgi:hypothetical protein
MVLRGIGGGRMTYNNEAWKDIAGYEGFYQVSNIGRVKTTERTDSLGRKVSENIKKPNLNINGYYQVTLYKNGHRKSCYIHRLVATAFIPNNDNALQVNHIDGVKTNNSARNLEWTTPSENSQHAYDTGLTPIPFRKGKNNNNSKLTEEQVIEIYTRVHKGEKQIRLAEEFKVNKGQIYKIKNGIAWAEITTGISVLEAKRDVCNQNL